MDGYLYPIIVEGDWGSELNNYLKNKLQIYFQSKKRSQGGDCIVQNYDQRSAAILFKSHGIREDVLSKAKHDIIIGSDQIRLKVSKPIAEQDLSHCACAYQKPTIEKFPKERSKCVRVENLPADSNDEMLLELYFEKHGGPVEEITTVPPEQAAIVTFKNEEDKDKVLKMEHKIRNVPVKIYPFYKSQDAALYGSNRPTLKPPEPITVSIHPAIRKFLLKKSLISSISDKMSKQFCQIDMDKPEVLLSPDPALLKQKGVNRRHIDGWAKNASDIFKSIISNYTVFELPVLYPVWTKAESDIKGLVTDQVFIYMDASKGALTMAGATHDINGLKSDVGKMLERASTQMERERSSVTEVMKVTPVVYSLLQQDGLQNALTASPQLHLDYNKKMSTLHLSGLQTEILTFKNWVLEKKLSMKEKPIKADRSLLEFLRSVNCEEMSKELFIAQGICAVYTVENEDLLLIGSTGQALSEAEKRLNMVLQTDITKVDLGLLELPQWQDFHKQLQHTRIEDAVCVKSHAVVEFIKERKSHDWQHFMKSDEVTVGFDSIRPRIKLSGERRFVQPAMSFFKKMADALYTDTLFIKKSGAKKYFKEEGRYMISMLMREKAFVVVLQEDHMLEGKSAGSSSTSTQKVQVMQVAKLTLEVSIGDITKETTDAIVNSSSHSFTLKAGVSKAILDAAGLQVEKECLQKGLGGANPDAVADAMIDAVVYFVTQTEPVHLKSVKFLIFQTRMLTDFHKSMHRRSSERVQKHISVMGWIQGWVRGLFLDGSASSRYEEFVMVVEEIEPAVFQLCGETPQDLNKAKDMIHTIIQRHKNIKICDPSIGHLTKKDEKILSAMQKELTVKIILERSNQDSVITIEGLTRDVHTAENRIRDMIRKVERKENRKREAFLVCSLVEWQYLDSGGNLQVFDMFTNYDLEEAFHFKTTVKIKINSDDFDVDVAGRVALNSKEKIQLKRVDLKAQCSLPSNWKDMKGQTVVLVPLPAGSMEYADVEKEFRRTGLAYKIIQVDRVQNSTLWSNYTIQQRHLEAKNKHKNNEKLLFHGTASDKTDQINHHGFNRSYAVMHGALYGKGTYFAVDPGYSARQYSTPDGKGHKRMYLARVLVGDFTLGRARLVAPPAKSSKDVDIYDSVTDNPNSPSMFVIFHDVQAYPEYLITFQ